MAEKGVTYSPFAFDPTNMNGDGAILDAVDDGVDLEGDADPVAERDESVFGVVDLTGVTNGDTAPAEYQHHVSSYPSYSDLSLPVRLCLAPAGGISDLDDGTTVSRRLSVASTCMVANLVPTYQLYLLV
jgi:hypothetical protein